jgi:HNH endonuclease
MTLIKHGLEAYERELTRERFAIVRKPRRSRAAPSAPSAPSVPSVPSASDRSASDRSASDRSTSDRSASDRSASDRSASDRPKPELSTSVPPKAAGQSMLNPHPHPNRNRKRHCPAAVARAVFLRDGQQCSYVSPDGRRCSARRFLELDHVLPWAMGGEGTIENLRLRCRAHNQRYARQYFGKSRVEAAVQQSRRRAATQLLGKGD